MMRNAFYFIFKALFVLKILNFCSDFFGHVEKRFDKEAEVISKFMTSQPGKQIVTISEEVKVMRQ